MCDVIACPPTSLDSMGHCKAPGLDFPLHMPPLLPRTSMPQMQRFTCDCFNNFLLQCTVTCSIVPSSLTSNHCAGHQEKHTSHNTCHLLPSPHRGHRN